jgi:hypothetical protein
LTLFVGLQLLTMSSGLAAAQEPGGPGSGLAHTPKLNVNDAVSQTGCVAAPAGPMSQITITSTEQRPYYRLIGKGLQGHMAMSSRVWMVGGLVPSPNIAAQAGSLDPTIVATAVANAKQADRAPTSVPHVAHSTRVNGWCQP